MNASPENSLAGLLSKLRSQALSQLEKYVNERAYRERFVFTAAEGNHAIFKKEFLDAYEALGDADVSEEFDELFTRFPDGVIRNRSENFDRTSQPGVFIGTNVEVAPELRRRVITLYRLCMRFGPAWRTHFQNTYVTLPENAMIIFWPEVGWAENADSDLNIPAEEYGYVADQGHNPNRNSVWTGVFYDEVAEVWMVSCETPVDVDGQHIATIGHDITLDELLDRAVNDHLPGSQNLIFRSDGRLIAHPDFMSEIKERGGYFEIAQSENERLNRLHSSIADSDHKSVAHIDASGEYSAIARIPEPDWYFGTISFDLGSVIDDLYQELEGQSEALTEVSTPVTELWQGILLLPLVGIIDSKRARQIMETSLTEVAKNQARLFILDVSGVAVVDTAVANHLIKITEAARLMGCDSVISGVSPAIAETIVELGVDIKKVRTTASMKDALAFAFAGQGLEIAASN